MFVRREVIRGALPSKVKMRKMMATEFSNQMELYLELQAPFRTCKIRRPKNATFHPGFVERGERGSQRATGRADRTGRGTLECLDMEMDGS